MNLQYLTLLGLIILVSWFLSRNAQSGVPKFIVSVTGLYFIFFYKFFSPATALGLGLILPHLNFIYLYTKQQIFIITRIGINSYYILLSIYFKIYHFFIWFKTLLKAFKIFFETKDFHKAKETYEQDNPKQEQEFNYSKYEEYESFYEEEQETSQKDDLEHIEEQIKDELKQFYSKDPYLVLGVNPSDDKQTIKKAYRSLLKEHHPDKNRDNIEEATFITQRINWAKEELDKIHK